MSVQILSQALSRREGGHALDPAHPQSTLTPAFDATAIKLLCQNLSRELDIPQGARVVVAMSGGVDSSVVAGLLALAGYEVIGITLQLYNHGAAVHRKGACCAGQDIHDARDVAAKLGIAHYVLDYEARFRQAVIDPFAQSYAAGETPIPCVACNAKVKFTDLLETAKTLGADVLATGHYVASRANGQGGRALYRAHDKGRDQSYFMFSTTPEQLQMLRFPLGNLPKAAVRQLAHGLGLSVADKHDSQDICFVPDGRYSDIVAKLQPNAARAGDIVHLDGRVLGTHQGIAHFTIGQRRGLGIANPEPLYVIKLDAAKNQVIVGPQEALVTEHITLRDINWLGDTPFAALPHEGLAVAVKLRSTRAPLPAFVFADGSVRLPKTASDPQGAPAYGGVSPGQACVFYDSAADDARVLGGGIIVSAQ